MENQTYEAAVSKVVNWWADKSFGGKLNQNNGDNRDLGGMAFALMNMVSLNAQSEVTPEKISLFKQRLTEILLSEDGKNWYGRCLSVDYHPDRPLAEACEFAGINTGCIPIKSSTWINVHNGSNATSASLGYGTRPVEI